MQNSRRVSGLAEIVDRYKLLLIDAYGVIHDGRRVFPGVNDALSRARKCGKTVFVVTNSPQRVEGVIVRLREAGVEDGNYDHIVCSGELTWRDLEVRFARSAASRVHFILQGSGVRWLSEVRNPIAQNISEADLIVAAGMPYASEPEALASAMVTALAEAVRRDLPMLIADSDETYPESGKVRLGPGWIARHYEKLGGKVVEFGKPFDPIYDEAMQLAGSPHPSEILMIGDNLQTDIRGAVRREFSSLMVLEGGVHGWLSAAELHAFSSRLGLEPTYFTQRLSW